MYVTQAKDKHRQDLIALKDRITFKNCISLSFGQPSLPGGKLGRTTTIQERKRSSHETNEEEMYVTQARDKHRHDSIAVCFTGWDNFRAGVTSSAWAT